MDDLLEKLTNSIEALFDSDGNEIVFKNKEIKMFKARYSSCPNETRTLFIDGKPLTNLKKTKIKVKYKCDCGAEKIIHLSKFLAKDYLTCTSCRENDEKIAWHKLYFEMKRNGQKRGNRSETHASHIVYDFDRETDDFKKDYFSRNLTQLEFEKISKYFYSVDNVLTGGKKLELIIAEPSANSKKYSQHVLIDGEDHRLKDINLKCQCCGKVFHITRQLKERALNNNTYCKYCGLSNISFSVKKYDDNLTYQSNQELTFIEKCKQRGILIVDGPSVPYEYEGRLHFYNVDFSLPEKQMLVEIKDNHVWHKKQVESGKWEAKESSAIEYAKENGYTYHLLFPEDIDNFFKTV